MKEGKKARIKKKLVKEIRELIFITAFLTLFLFSLTIYHGVLLGKNIFSYFSFGYNALEALILAKVILIGQMLKLGERFSHLPLIIPTIYRSFIFTLFVAAFKLGEHFVRGFFQGHAARDVWQEILDKGANDIFGMMLITFLVFFLLFCFLGISNYFGEGKIFDLFFRRHNKPDTSHPRL